MPTMTAHRRHFLKTLGAGAAALPFHSLLERSAGAATTPPMRLLLLCTGYGGRWEYMRPQGLAGAAPPRMASDVPLTAESISYPNSSLAPLAPFVSQMTVLEGVALTEGLIDRTLYVGHEGYAPNMWTGGKVPRLKNTPNLPTSESLDFTLGQKFGGATAVRSIELGPGTPVTPGTESNASFLYNAAGQRLPGFSKPGDAFRALFGSAAATAPGTPVAPGADFASVRDKKVIAAVQAGAKRVRARLGGIERKKLDEHLAALADIESHLTSSAAQAGAAQPGVSCKSPSEPAASSDIRLSTQAHFSLIRQALACDRTRYVSVAWGIACGPIPGVLDTSIKDMHGQIAHVVGSSGPTGDAARLNMALTQKWYASQLADLMQQMATDQDGNGTSVLDNTLIVWAQDFGHDVHGGLNIPYVLLGGGQKKFRMGRYLNVRKATPGSDWKTYEANNRLLVSMLNGFGVPVDTFGSTEFPGPLPGILA